MRKQKKQPVAFILIFSAFILLIILLMQPLEIGLSRKIAVLFPKGDLAYQERNLLLIIQAIMLLVVLPVYLLTFLFSWKYRAHNKKAKYTPDWGDHPIAELIWWGVPCLLILVIGTLTWIRTYQLDPFKPLVSDEKPIKIQVVALQWNWLFIYPEEKIATLNFCQFPEKRALNFEITADAPMNSFWIPQLGGQIYAMPKMRSQLHLIANEVGEFRGSSANLSGNGFSGMHFIAKASTEEEYAAWVKKIQSSSSVLHFKEYQRIAMPSEEHPLTTYSLGEEDLFDQVIMKFMKPPEKDE